ncbi:MAG: hypothetical protein V3T24_08850, partial [Longimicrobiales bacterium]
MTPDPQTRLGLPDPVRRTLDEFRAELGLDIYLWKPSRDGTRVRLYPPHHPEDGDATSNDNTCRVVRTISPRDGPDLELEICSSDGAQAESLTSLLKSILERTFDFAQEVRFFTYELSERYEEINLLYSISETLG